MERRGYDEGYGGGYSGGSHSHFEVRASNCIGSDFTKFKSNFPLQKHLHPRSSLEWSYYQAGPSAGEPIMFLHGTSSTAAAFFYQVQHLGSRGYRVISAQYPAYDSPEDWCKGFDLFLDAIKCRACHIFGAGLGGFLAQHFAMHYPNRIRSLILCNAFASTHAFAHRAGTLSSMIFLMPTPLLRQAVLDAFPQGGLMELSAKQAIDWVAQQVNDLTGDDLASRLSLNCGHSEVNHIRLDSTRITIIEANGETMVPEELRRQLKHMYHDARFVQLKASGDFPYLSKPDEVSLFIEVHMRACNACPSSAAPKLSSGDDAESSMTTAGQALRASTRGSESQYPQFGGDGAALYSDPPSQKKAVWKNPFEDDPLL
eukprot:TRINITY_DN38744_c0_g1_i1.p1 TRINITY_DN38744_c0_g1~~TRINITY_DN38744_c0_g1_i1.p1  ORF type:complete len:371 (+),score=56.20 TRINITY_DN38744_c0_g1_i1:42-1154(+)